MILHQQEFSVNAVTQKRGHRSYLRPNGLQADTVRKFIICAGNQESRRHQRSAFLREQSYPSDRRHHVAREQYRGNPNTLDTR
ncbi:hypothetical protein PoB_000309800 [Plakobranchus ocellatus]|uniref:Uncharacterized protein n=1 Tax=Plakobranchus ocellatus TaxID=259542 RepID=A0AAV3Y1S8_9GAST|nr:hypothetical protein PoB_000309800 [Plakobranchus ocellatus]